MQDTCANTLLMVLLLLTCLWPASYRGPSRRPRYRNRFFSLTSRRASQEAQWLRTCLPMQETQETWVWSLDWEDPLEKEMATHSGILAWKIPCAEEPGRLQSLGSQRVRPQETWLREGVCGMTQERGNSWIGRLINLKSSYLNKRKSKKICILFKILLFGLNKFYSNKNI